MSEYYRVKPTDVNNGPVHGIYVTKEERNKTILTVSIILLISFLKRKLAKKFRH